VSVGGALADVLVADFSSVLAGPYLTMLLGDLGATVIKVERPEGDSTRGWGPPWHADGTSTYYESVNRNKRGMVLDLADSDDRALAVELAVRADVLVQNLLPGRMERRGLGYEQLGAINPRLVYCSISGFGAQPRAAALPGYDLLAQALSGLMSITGAPEGPPTKVGVALVDVLCGLHGAVAVLAALQARHASGRGQHVEVDLASGALSALVNQATGFLQAGVVPSAMGNAHPSVAPYESFTAADGELIVAVGSDRQFAGFCDAVDRPEWAIDERFATNTLRVRNRPVLRPLIADVLAVWRRAEAVARLRACGVPCGPVNDVEEAFAFAQRIGLEPVWSADGRRYVRSPFRLGEDPPTLRRVAPRLDQDGASVREWLLSDRGPALQ
jgi:crotonobetainyl-CoA:carnitine CoA-transferase CaiB-like acyl-CoA transferase